MSILKLLHRTSVYRKKTKLIPEFNLQTEYYRRKLLHETMKDSLTSSGKGVKVLWMPANSGKSTTSYKVVNELVGAHHYSGIIYTKGGEGNLPSFVDWYQTFVPTGKRLSSLLPIGAPILVFVDHVEHLLMNPSDFRLIKTLAQESVETKTFTVFLTTNCPITAQKIFELNNAEKIRAIGSLDGPCFDIDFEHAFAVAKEYKMIRNMKISAEDLKEIAKCAVLSKSFGTVVGALTEISKETVKLSPEKIGTLHEKSEKQHQHWKIVRQKFKKYYPL